MGVGASVNKSSKEDGKVNKPDHTESHKNVKQKQSSIVSSANNLNDSNNNNNNNNNPKAPSRLSWNTNNKQQQQEQLHESNNDKASNSPVTNSTDANRKSTRFSAASGTSAHSSGSSNIPNNNDALYSSIGSSGGGGRVLTKFNSLRNLWKVGTSTTKVEPEEMIGASGGGVKYDPLNTIPENISNHSNINNSNSNSNSNLSSNRTVMSGRKYSMSIATEKLILSALSESNYLNSSATNSDNVDSTTAATTTGNTDTNKFQELILRRLEKEEFDADDVIIREGEKGDKVYIIESGVVRVTQQGEEIREMTVGSLFGVIALTYNALRTATVTCVTETVVWSLKRDVFKRIQEHSSSDIDKRRTEWLINIPEFAILSALDQAKLVGCLQPRVYDIGDYIYREDEISNQCVLIEYGLAAVFSSKPLVSDEDDDIDKELFIYRHVPLSTAALNKANGLSGTNGKRRNSTASETGGGGGISGKRRNSTAGDNDGGDYSNSSKNDNNLIVHRSNMKVSKINDMISKIVQSTFKKNSSSSPSSSPTKANTMANAGNASSAQSLLTLSQKQKVTQTLSGKNIGSSAKPIISGNASVGTSASDNSISLYSGGLLTSTSHHESASPRDSSSSSTNILNNSNSRTSISNAIGDASSSSNSGSKTSGSPISNKNISKKSTIGNATINAAAGYKSNSSNSSNSSPVKQQQSVLKSSMSHQSVSSSSEDPSTKQSHPSQQSNPSQSTNQSNLSHQSYSQKTLLHQQQKSDLSTETFITMLNEGCVVGVGILRGKACIPGAWPWQSSSVPSQPSLVPSSKATGDMDRVGIDGGNVYSSGASVAGAVVPISVIATERVEALIFTVDAFENAFGTIDVNVLTANNSTIPTTANTADSSKASSTAGSNNTVATGGMIFFPSAGSISTYAQSISNFSTSTTDTKKMLTFTHHRRVAVEDKPIPLKKFTDSQFQQSFILGNGSYGVVVLAEYKRMNSNENSNSDLNANNNNTAIAVTNVADQTNTTIAAADMLSIMELSNQNRINQQLQQQSNKLTSNTPTYYALKILSKNDIVEMEQVRHVTDEMKLLSEMSSRFVIKLYGTYQTLNEIVLVTEVVYGCDLWSIIYDQSHFIQVNNNIDGSNSNINPGVNHNDSDSNDNTSNNHEPVLGLSMSVVKFYAACLISALAHIHDKGVVYRDLKPENIMIDDKGYIRLIDFGFAKKVPYTKVMKATGQERTFVKTYTLCGTPEYLSPEMIFNTGHDQSTDIWSIGILIHEMILAATPFAPKRADNITELFTNIALVKKTGYTPSAELLRCSGSDSAVVDLIEQMLQAEPRQRIGVIKQSTWSILRHLFFLGFHMSKIHDGSYTPEYLPRTPELFESVVNSTVTRNYKGDQSIFEAF